jgi:hypothetical protein
MSEKAVAVMMDLEKLIMGVRKFATELEELAKGP